MFTVEKRVGRLVEARFGSPLSCADVESAVHLAQAIGDAAPGQIVSYVDVSRLDLVPPAAVDMIIALFTRYNPKVVRGAFLLPSVHGTVSIQMEHMIRKAGIAQRRCFRDPTLLQRWLEDVLTPHEAVRLAQFLATRPPAATHVAPTIAARSTSRLLWNDGAPWVRQRA